MIVKTCNIRVVDFNLFCDFVKTATKIVDSAKILLSPAGAAIYGARKPFARCELQTSAVQTDEPAEFCVLDLAMLNKVLQTVRDVHGGDFSDLSLSLDGEKLCFKSKKFKSKLQTQRESIVEKWVSTRVQTALKPVFEFKTSRELIRRVKSHQFIFSDLSAVRVYLATSGDDMESGSVFATLSNRATRLDNEMTLKFGLATFGQLSGQLVLDLDRLNLLDSMPTEEQTVKLMDANVLVSEVSSEAKSGAFFTAKLYLSILKP